MKRFAGFMLTAMLVLLAMSGCARETAGTVTTGGSTSMEAVIGALGEAFEEQSGNVTFTPHRLRFRHQAVLEGRCDIGLSSRDLKPEVADQGLTGTVLACDAIAVIVHPDNPVTGLDADTIAEIYTGGITDWQDIGGRDAEIVLIGREAGSGTRDGFESVTGTEDACQYRREPTSTGDVITAVSQNPDAIGHASLASVKDMVRVVTVDGPHGGHRERRRLCHSAALHPGHEDRHAPLGAGAEVL